MPPRDQHMAGLDAVRVAATALVTVQHVFTLLGHEAESRYRGLSIGQVGVALFIAISGQLAGDSRHPPLTWLLHRFRRLYPPYWIVLAASFVLAGVSGRKSFDAAQVVAQGLGIGLFTHRANLVNLPTWFVSLLLTCYLGTFLARLTRVPGLVAVLISIRFVVVVARDSDPWLTTHFLTYAVASALNLVAPPWRSRAVGLLVIGFVALAVTVQPAFVYTAIALTVVELASHMRSIPGLVRLAAGYTYEYYLIHGVALASMIWLLPAAPVAAVSVALLVASAAAVALQWVVRMIESRITRRPAHPSISEVAAPNSSTGVGA